MRRIWHESIIGQYGVSSLHTPNMDKHRHGMRLGVNPRTNHKETYV